MFKIKTAKKTPAQLREAREFQPDAIMLESHAPPISLHAVWFLIVLLLFLMIVWAAIAKVDKIVSSDGKVVTSRSPITMKPLELTTIRKVHVRTGQRVQEGDILFTFDQTVNASEAGRLKEQRRSYEANAERLRAEINGYGESFVLPVNPDGDRTLQQSIYEARKNYYLQKLRSYDENISRYKKTLDTLEKSMAKFEDRKEALDRIEKMMVDLHEKNVTSLKELLQTQIDVIGMGIQVDQQTVSIVENRQQVLATEAERDAFIHGWKQEMVEKLVDIERSLISLDKEITKYEMLVSKTEMRAPCNAVVHEIAPFQEGSAVREAEALITLIPTDVELEAEVDIPAKDISWVKIGDKCRLKFDAFPFQQCGTLDGEIIYISQDAFNKAPQAGQDEGAPDGGRLSAGARGVTYQARLKISGNFTGIASHAQIIPGMRLKAEIKVGKRTVLNYIFNPFTKALDEAIREP